MRKKIEQFEDIEAWQQARLLNQQVYNITRTGAFANDITLKDQIKRATNSVMFNIAEGFARRSNREFHQFLFMAHGSVAELQSALYVSKDQRYINEEEFNYLYQQADKVSTLLVEFIQSLGNT